MVRPRSWCAPTACAPAVLAACIGLGWCAPAGAQQFQFNNARGGGGLMEAILDVAKLFPKFADNRGDLRRLENALEQLVALLPQQHRHHKHKHHRKGAMSKGMQLANQQDRPVADNAGNDAGAKDGKIQGGKIQGGKNQACNNQGGNKQGDKNQVAAKGQAKNGAKTCMNQAKNTGNKVGAAKNANAANQGKAGAGKAVAHDAGANNGGGKIAKGAGAANGVAAKPAKANDQAKPGNLGILSGQKGLAKNQCNGGKGADGKGAAGQLAKGGLANGPRLGMNASPRAMQFVGTRAGNNPGVQRKK